MPIVVARATTDDIDALTPLFDAYRVFYGQASASERARSFIEDRMRLGESVIFLCRDTASGTELGFTQLYPSFSSVAARRTWILNDLFVAPDARERGVARALMEAAREFAAASGAIRINLETGDGNRAAWTLYESLGYVREAGTRHYALTLE